MLFVPLVMLIALAGILFAFSPGTIQPFLNEEGNILAGSISEKIFVEIGGVRQGMFIRGKNIQNPILLYVHGGPSFSEFFLVDKFPTGLEEHFTVCYWEQRGGGLSYNSDVSLESMTLEQLISDTLQVTAYLRERFGQEKIYLAGHSGGTVLAIHAVAQVPEYYHAYIGIAQITNQKESEKLAHDYMLSKYIESGNKTMVDKLGKYPISEDDSYIAPFFKAMVRDQAMHNLGIGTMRNMKSLEKGIVYPIMLCPAYTLSEKFNLWKSKISFIRKSGLADEILSLDVPAAVPELKVPVYFFSGAYDYTVNHDLSKEFLLQLKAPIKGFYTFAKSAHSPNFEEPERMMSIITQDVLTGGNSLADFK